MPAVNVNIQPEIISWALSQTQEENLGDKLMNNITQWLKWVVAWILVRIKVLFTFSLKDVRKLSEKVMDIVYLPEKSFDNEEKLDIIKVK